MVRSLQRLKQLAVPDNYEDQKTASEIADIESAAADFEEAFHGILSQLKRIIHGNDAGNWSDDPSKLPARSYKEVACLVEDSIGNGMYIRGERVNGKWRAGTADPEDRNKMPAIGILVSKSTPTVGVVQLFGVCDLFTEMTPGSPILVGKDGNLIEEVPTIATGEYFWAQQIGLAVSDDLLMLSGESSMIRYTG